MEKSGFFNAMKVDGEWDRVYKAENFAEYFATFIGNGVFPNPANQLQVKETDKMQVVLKGGRAWINGFIYINTEDLMLNIDVADGVLNRIDKIVLRYDVAKREIRAVVKKGQYASNPIAPILDRNADMHELGLADIRINAGAIKISQSDITDLRLNNSYCGIVHGTVDQVDTTAIFNQFQSWYSTTKDNYNKDMVTWTTEKKQAFEEWYSTNTEAFKKQFTDWYGNNTTQWTNDFTNWFETIKGQLDGDIAAKLTNDIERVKKDVETLTNTKAFNGNWNNFNWNYVTHPGVYSMHGTSENAPDNNKEYGLIITRSEHKEKDRYVEQLALEQSTGKMFIRCKNNANWTPWKQIIDENLLNEVKKEFNSQLAENTKQVNTKMDKQIKDDSTNKKYELGIKNGLLYYREV